MSDQFVGEIRWFTYMRGAPSGWMVCDGSVQQLANYEMLGALIGNAYGGDGQTTFGVPDLRGRVPVHQGTGPGLTQRPMGQMGGSETASLAEAQMPAHTHLLMASAASGTATSPIGAMMASPGDGATMYLENTSGATAATPLPQMFGSVGNGTPHDNCAPSLPLLACIAWEGQWPTRP